MSGEPQCIMILDEQAAAFSSADQTNGFLSMECRDEHVKPKKSKESSRLVRFFTHLAEVNPRVFSMHGLSRNRYR